MTIPACAKCLDIVLCNILRISSPVFLPSSTNAFQMYANTGSLVFKGSQTSAGRWGCSSFPQKQSCPTVTVSTEKLVFSVFLSDHFLSQNESWFNDLINSTYFHVGDDKHNGCQLRDVIWQQCTRDHDLQIMLLL